MPWSSSSRGVGVGPYGSDTILGRLCSTSKPPESSQVAQNENYSLYSKRSISHRLVELNQLFINFNRSDYKTYRVESTHNAVEKQN